ncbi:hypothetical protein PQR34_46360 [Paraburkholderia sediminicola]|uniref:hypothetical protein n=1 Tax=Paraburkholderia sediminicola TaxID=458836 RepID=UPI0038BBB572
MENLDCIVPGYRDTPDGRRIAEVKLSVFDMGDGTYAPQIMTVGNPGGVESSGYVERIAVTTEYTSAIAFPGADANETITSTQIINVSSTPQTTEAVLWRNQTQGADLSATPPTGSLLVVGSRALTNAELRAAPVSVKQTDMVNGRLPVRSSAPTAASVIPMSVTTPAAGGAAFSVFADQTCDALDIVNMSGVTIEYQRDGGGVAVPVGSGTSRMVIGIANANEVGIRRIDQVAASVMIAAEAITA